MYTSEILERFLIYVNDEHGDDWSEGASLAMINAAYEELQNVVESGNEDFFSTQYSTGYTTTAGTYDQEFTLPSDFRILQAVERQVSGSNPVPMEVVDYSYRRLYGNWSNLREIFGTDADFAYLRGNKIGVTYASSAYTFVLTYLAQQAALADMNDIPQIPTAYHDLIAQVAAYKANKRDGKKTTMIDKRDIEEGKRMLRMHASRRSPAELGEAHG